MRCRDFAMVLVKTHQSFDEMLRSCVAVICPETLDVWDLDRYPQTFFTLVICAGLGKPLVVVNKYGIDTPEWVKKVVPVFLECDEEGFNDAVNSCIEQMKSSSQLNTEPNVTIKFEV